MLNLQDYFHAGKFTSGDLSKVLKKNLIVPLLNNKCRQTVKDIRGGLFCFVGLNPDAP